MRVLGKMSLICLNCGDLNQAQYDKLLGEIKQSVICGFLKGMPKIFYQVYIGIK